MKPYRRFEFTAAERAKVATLATFDDNLDQSVTTLAIVAGFASRTTETTAYRRFKFDAGTPATDATIAKIDDSPARNVAKLASVAGGARKDAMVVPDWAPEPDHAEIEYRKAMAMDSVPERYLDAWARLQVQRPANVSDDEWWRAMTDGGLFLDRWGAQAVQFGWSPGDLFDVPRDGKQGGLVWFLRGEAVRALGPEHAITDSGRDFARGQPTHAPSSRP